MIEENRIPHALLFAGLSGVGKKLFSLELARASFCQKLENFFACNNCSPCMRSTRFDFANSGKKGDYLRVFFSDHPDIGMIIPNKQTIYIDAIRQLETEANFRPYEASARFFIVDEAEKMSRQASNALLKTLEEPTKTSYIFLITSRQTSLPSTLRSRCQIIHFEPIQTDDIMPALLKHGFSPKDSKLVANFSRGSIGKALSIDLESFQNQRKKMLEALECLIEKNNRSALLRISEEINEKKNRAEYEKYLEVLQTLLHDIWILRQGYKSFQIVNFDLLPKLEKFSENPSSSNLHSWIQEIETLREHLNFNLNRKIATDALFMKMAS